MPPEAGSPALDAGGSVTTLTTACGNQTTAIPVADAAAIASTAASYAGSIQIDGEVMPVSGVNLASNTLTVVRSSQPPATSHAASAAVYFEYDQSGNVVQMGSLAIGAEQFRPAVSQISPASGPMGGGTSVTISGLELTDATAVDFGTTPATTFSFKADSSQLTATSPAGTGTVDVTVTTPEGTSITSTADQFTYTPAVTAISPASGPAGGGTAVIIYGLALDDVTAVDFGTTPATSFSYNYYAQLTATSPAGTGMVDVTVTTSDGTSVTSAADQFTYNAAAQTSTQLTSSANPSTAGDSLTLTATVSPVSAEMTGEIIDFYDTTTSTDLAQGP